VKTVGTISGDGLAGTDRVEAAIAGLPELAGITLHILVVDPDPAFRDAIERRLHHLGHRVTLSSNCNDGWDMAQAAQFDAVIIDVETPAITALELARRITAMPQSPAMIGTSPNASAAGRLTQNLLRDSGFQALISKDQPVRSFGMKLTTALRKAITRRTDAKRRRATGKPRGELT
jgi:CheY-like chemotaxis protein